MMVLLFLVRGVGWVLRLSKYCCFVQVDDHHHQLHIIHHFLDYFYIWCVNEPWCWWPLWLCWQKSTAEAKLAKQASEQPERPKLRQLQWLYQRSYNPACTKFRKMWPHVLWVLKSMNSGFLVQTLQAETLAYLAIEHRTPGVSKQHQYDLAEIAK